MTTAKKSIVEEALSAIEADAKKIETEIAAIEKDAVNFLPRLKALLGPNLIHFTGQLGALYTIATHDLTRWENALVPLLTAVGTTAVKKAGAKIK